MHTHGSSPSRRDFLSVLLKTACAGAGLLEIAAYRAAWAQAGATTAAADLFEIEKVAEGAYFAFARAAIPGNCNAAIYVMSNSVLVVDSHARPSAASALIAQLRKEVTTKPVRYLVNTHFHWDHTQGNAAYLAGGEKVDIIASETTKRQMSELLVPRLKESLIPNGKPFAGYSSIPRLLDDLRKRVGESKSEPEKATLNGQIRQLEAFAAEMRNFEPVYPTITFDNTYLIKDRDQQLHLEFHGRAHTAGDVVVYSPQRRVVATGDMIIGSFPFMADCFPQSWPKTIASVGKLDFERILPGHGRVQQGKQHMTNMANYIEELHRLVAAGKEAGKSIAELQQSITVTSLQSLRSNGYGEALTPAVRSDKSTPAEYLKTRINVNVADVYTRIGIG